MADNSEDTYVTQAGWLSVAGRVDLIDDVADSFERPSSSSWPDGRSDFWSGRAAELAAHERHTALGRPAARPHAGAPHALA